MLVYMHILIYSYIPSRRQSNVIATAALKVPIYRGSNLQYYLNPAVIFVKIVLLQNIVFCILYAVFMAK